MVCDKNVYLAKRAYSSSLNNDARLPMSFKQSRLVFGFPLDFLFHCRCFANSAKSICSCIHARRGNARVVLLSTEDITLPLREEKNQPFPLADVLCIGDV